MDRPLSDAEQQAARKLGQRMQRLRERKGWTQETLGRKAGHYSRSTIAIVETGWGKCSLKLIQGCDNALEAHGELVKLFFELKDAEAQRKEAAWSRRRDDGCEASAPSPDRLDDDRIWQEMDAIMISLPVMLNGRVALMPISLSRRKFLAAGGVALLGSLLDPDEWHRAEAMVEGRHRPDMQMVQHFEALLAHYRQLDDLAGQRHVHGPVRSTLGIVDDLCKVAQPVVRQALLSVSAQYHQLDGRLWLDSGNSAMAQRSFDRGIARASESGDQALVGYLLICKSQQADVEGNNAAALSLAQEAQTPKWRLTPAVRALAASRETLIRALWGETDACLRKLDVAAELLTESVENDRADEPPWIYWYTEEIPLFRGVCYLRLGQAERAISVLDEEIARPPGEFVRDRAFYLRSSAKAHARNNDPEQAGRMALQAAQLAIDTGSTIVLKDLHNLHSEMGAWKDAPAVRDLGDFLRQAGVHQSGEGREACQP